MDNILSEVKDKLSRNSFLQSLPVSFMLDLLNRWQEPHRHYHNLKHLHYLLCLIETHQRPGSEEILQVIALMHDIIYNPTKTDNEEMSAKLMMRVMPNLTYMTYNDNNVADIVYNAILATKAHHQAKTELEQTFCYYDVKELLEADTARLIVNEGLLFKEFQFATIPEYKEKKKKFLTKFIEDWQLTGDVANRLQAHIEYVEKYRPKIGIYQMESLHDGHLDILKQADNLFDKVVVVYRFANTDTLHDMRQRLPFREVTQQAYSNFLTYYQQFGDVTLIHGIHNDDVDIQYLRNIQRLVPGVNNICIACQPQYAHLISSFFEMTRQFGKD